MLQAPEKLFQKALSLGFHCSSNGQEHRITPANPLDVWKLIYKSGHWVLFVNGVPQMNLDYSEVNNFIERRSCPERTEAMLSA